MLVLEMALHCTLPASTDNIFLLDADASKVKESHGIMSKLQNPGVPPQ